MSERVPGFSLNGVGWGYRDVFRRVIESLYAEGLLGPGNEAVTRQFFDLLQRGERSERSGRGDGGERSERSERNLFDHVLYDFVRALNPRTRWIVSLPAIFADVTEMGCGLAQSRIYYGTTFFRLLGEGGLGRTPEEVSHLMSLLKRVRAAAGEEVAFALLRGYRRLVERLAADEIERYTDEALLLHASSPRTAQRFLEGTLAGSEAALQALGRECSLASVAGHLARLVRALSGRRVEIADLSALQGGEQAVARGSQAVCFHHRLHLPHRVRSGGSRAENRGWYVLAAIASAALYEVGGFPLIHGHPSFLSADDLVGGEPLGLNLFVLVEQARALRHIRDAWPGAARLLEQAVAAETSRPGTGPTARLLAALAGGGDGGQAASAAASPEAAALSILRRVVSTSVSAFDTAAALTPPLRAKVGGALPALAAAPLPPVGFLPDFLYRGASDVEPPEALVAGLRRRTAARERGESAKPHAAAQARGRAAGKRSPAAGSAGFLYDEWSQGDHDYLSDHCVVHQITVEPLGSAELPPGVLEQARRTRRIFEWMKPEVARKEKRLESGDAIDVDLLVEFLVDRRREPSPRVRFYQKPRIQRRDLATLILMDVSGSTGEEREARRIIEIERESALILGHGLAGLGDHFAICGFSGQGRENCEYYVYKGFTEPWGPEAIRRLAGAAPRSSTRIGAALRHSGTLLDACASRQKLLLLVTDGRPMDAGYDPESRYAQFDVRMACEENRRRSIHTFAISTERASRADMEIMFPGRRFTILPSIEQLPSVLPRLYMRLTN